ncbi:chemotaxis-specific protein-glutamate methyltransferase CheB [Fulvivirga sp. 29W222]|uniref:Protein-glutamate methylesterase/protein-glutamine glutaminase n=1 Tax=Fulvivirga marina TaxID=2494733 RepID=A0A937KC87_9BACT|nr:chemotaxis-specific protein-glutamate methyltransferase CheB [Fulvivirga marina]MBL6447109.1 chemotaxis-specific protein-glutamate methyltransferase CheB [Fulvivirga marina]
MKRIKTLLIEDSGLMRIMISDVLRSDPTIEVIGTANNGKDGVRKVKALRPDVVVTDMLMPHYDGLYAVKNIMKETPVPIILLSSLGKNNREVFEALNTGAFDFIDKPTSRDSIQFKKDLNKLIQTIKAANETNLALLKKNVSRVNHQVHSFSNAAMYSILVIGASTGGPSAVSTILGQLPINLPIPVIIAQHMPERFLVSFAERLDSLLPFEVQLAKKGERLRSGVIYILPGDGNMEVANQNDLSVFKYSDKIYKEYDRPSINCLFESVAEVYGSKAIGVILTGMGKDGSQGLLKIKHQGGLTITQDALSSVVYGMPKASVELGAADYVVKLNDIPGFLMSCF